MRSCPKLTCICTTLRHSKTLLCEVVCASHLTQAVASNMEPLLQPGVTADTHSVRPGDTPIMSRTTCLREGGGTAYIREGPGASLSHWSHRSDPPNTLSSSQSSWPRISIAVVRERSLPRLVCSGNHLHMIDRSPPYVQSPRTLSVHAMQVQLRRSSPPDPDRSSSAVGTPLALLDS